MNHARQDRDFYPTPAWPIEALAKHVELRGKRILECACGDGRIARVLEAAGANVTAFDIAPDYGYGGGVDSFSDDLRKGHEDEDVGFGLVHADGKLRYFRAQLIGDLAPLQFCAVEIVLGEGGCDGFLRVCGQC